MFIGSHPFSSFSPGILVKIKKKKKKNVGSFYYLLAKIFVYRDAKNTAARTLRDLPCDFVMCKRGALCDLCLVWSACGWIGNDLRSVWRWWIRPLSAPSSLESKGKKRTIHFRITPKKKKRKILSTFSLEQWREFGGIRFHCLTALYYTFLSSSSLFISRHSPVPSNRG